MTPEIEEAPLGPGLRTVWVSPGESYVVLRGDRAIVSVPARWLDLLDQEIGGVHGLLTWRTSGSVVTASAAGRVVAPLTAAGRTW